MKEGLIEMSKVKDNAGAECPPKVKAIYQAVFELFEEGTDLNSLTVSEITKKAGISPQRGVLSGRDHTRI